MCDLAGALNFPTKEIFEKLKGNLTYRGPDEQNIFIENNVDLIHTRLAIQNIQHGHLPMCIARSPFLSKEIIQLAARLPNHYKINGASTKFILRQLPRQYLPEELLHQPKHGFKIQLKAGFKQKLKDKMYDYLNPHSKVGEYLERKIHTSDEKRAKMLWSLLATEIWLQQH